MRRERRLRLLAAAADRDLPARVAQNRRAETGSPEIPANALLAQLVEHFHGKEGVVGSSPTEGLDGSLLFTGFARLAAVTTHHQAAYGQEEVAIPQINPLG